MVQTSRVVVLFHQRCVSGPDTSGSCMVLMGVPRMRYLRYWTVRHVSGFASRTRCLGFQSLPLFGAVHPDPMYGKRVLGIGLAKEKKMYKKKACSKHSKASNRPSLRLDCHCTLTLITDSLSSPVPPLSAGNTMKTRFKALFACVALISSGSILTLLHPSPHALPSFANLVSLGTTFDADRAETLQLLSQLYEGERMFLLADYDQTAEEQIIRSPPGALDPDFDRYIARLESFVDTYFNRSIFHRPLSTSLERMIDGRPPLAQGSSGGGSFTQRIYSFDKGGPGGAPREFGWWRKRLGEEWVIEVGDDVRMEGWFDEMVGMETIVPDLPGQEGESVGTDTVGTGKSTWEELWFGLGRPVLKSDILRYLLMLLRGGMYTDSDTAILSDPDLWGTHAIDHTPRGLAALQRAMQHFDPDTLSTRTIAQKTDELGSLDPHERLNKESGFPVQSLLQGDPAAPLGPASPTSLGIHNPSISLVLSIEYDAHHPRQDPRVGYTRDLQFVQWTFMAKPFHPVFLDVLEFATTRLMRHRDDASQAMSDTEILDSTGPGAFTDAIFRYLLVQYGVTPQDLLNMEDGAVIGDVLILPLHAFGAYTGSEEDWNAVDPTTRCTSHSFKGRWRGE
ncbi:hypothetical protein DB88DRAFT_477812 [Papiliotrema laurentii]|uniref:Uncharacterized protein n=1 Tax=Papiliotrema laurentii TaxID=5418 RepID=A0AAD9FW51_PAPLA|nr:hypothetical protein DB88DRAFT_477812 [Papiliotrema laurentii]